LARAIEIGGGRSSGRDCADNFTMAVVAERAGVSVGTMYRRFTGKEQLYSNWTSCSEADPHRGHMRILPPIAI
jgi:hypothetical protein